MLQETNIQFGATSWRFLTDPDELANNELIDPFDYVIYQLVPPRDAASQPTLNPTGRTFEPEGVGSDAFDAIHRRVVGGAVAALPHNARIAAGNTAHLHGDAQAEMAENDDDPAEAEAAVGVNVLAGTGGVSPCVAVLARAPLNGNRWRVGCIHLSVNDMETFQLATAALDRLLVKLSSVSQDANTGPVELYVVGGCEDEDVAYEEFSRVIAAAQIRAAAQGIGVVPVQLAGARIPASVGKQYVDVYIGANGVTYSVQQVQ